MSNKPNSVAGWLFKVALALLLAATAMPSIAQAQSPDPARGIWMAASLNQASLNGRSWGRLSMVDGVLAFQSSSYEWRLALSEIKRIGASKDLSSAFEVESASGQVYYVGILDSRMTMTAPGKTVQAIKRAVLVAPTAPARLALVAAGGGTP